MIIDLIYDLNYLVFACFLSLFLLEVGIAIVSLVNYSEYGGEIKRYLHSMWAINGTFAVFYLVEFEASYPNLLKSIGTVYVFPALIAGVLIIARNAFMAYSELVDQNLVRRYLGVYSIATLIIAFLAVSILTSSVSGAGINLSDNSVNMLLLFFNSFNILVFGGLALLVYFFASAYFKRREHFIPATVSGIIGIILIMAAISSEGYMVQNIIASLYIPVIILLIFLLVAFLYLKGYKYTRYIAFGWIFVAILAFGTVQYPYLFGGTLNIAQYETSGAIGHYVILITVAGGAFLLVLLSYLFYLYHRKSVG